MNKKGFTLIEMLVVLTIIGILAGLILTAFVGARKSARDGQRRTDLEQIRSALEMYRTDNGTYPKNLSSLSSYIELPKDPVSGDNYFYSRLSVNTYILCAILETGGTDTCSGCSECNYKVTNP